MFQILYYTVCVSLEAGQPPAMRKSKKGEEPRFLSNSIYKISREELFNYVLDLDDEHLEYISNQCDIILSAHGDIQDEHRNQARSLLRAYAGGVGLILAIIGFVLPVFQQKLTGVNIQNLTQSELVAGFAFAIVVAIGFIISLRGFFKFSGIILLIVQILTPERISIDSSVSSLFVYLPFFPKEAILDLGYDGDEYPREGIRRVIEAEELRGTAQHPRYSDRRVITEKIILATNNEVVINNNMKQLSRTYEIISQTLLDILLASTLFVIAAILPAPF